MRRVGTMLRALLAAAIGAAAFPAGAQTIETIARHAIVMDYQTGTVLMERIVKITSVARHSQAIEPVEPPRKAQTALEQLQAHVRRRGAAA